MGNRKSRFAKYDIQDTIEQLDSTVGTIAETDWMWDQDDGTEDPWLHILVDKKGNPLTYQDVEPFVDKMYEGFAAYEAGDYSMADDIFMDAYSIAIDSGFGQTLLDVLNDDMAHYENMVPKRKRAISKRQAWDTETLDFISMAMQGDDPAPNKWSRRQVADGLESGDPTILREFLSALDDLSDSWLPEWEDDEGEEIYDAKAVVEYLLDDISEGWDDDYPGRYSARKQSSEKSKKSDVRNRKVNRMNKYEHDDGYTREGAAQALGISADADVDEAIEAMDNLFYYIEDVAELASATLYPNDVEPHLREYLEESGITEDNFDIKLDDKQTIAMLTYFGYDKLLRELQSGDAFEAAYNEIELAQFHGRLEREIKETFDPDQEVYYRRAEKSRRRVRKATENDLYNLFYEMGYSTIEPEDLEYAGSVEELASEMTSETVRGMYNFVDALEYAFEAADRGDFEEANAVFEESNPDAPTVWFTSEAGVEVDWDFEYEEMTSDPRKVISTLEAAIPGLEDELYQHALDWATEVAGDSDVSARKQRSDKSMSRGRAEKSRRRVQKAAIESVEDVEAVVEEQIERVRATNVYGWMESRPFPEDISEEEIDYYIDFKDSVFNAFRELENDLAAGYWPESTSAWDLHDNVINALIGEPNEISQDFPAIWALDAVLTAIDGLERLEESMQDEEDGYYDDDEEYDFDSRKQRAEKSRRRVGKATEDQFRDYSEEFRDFYYDFLPEVGVYCSGDRAFKKLQEVAYGVAQAGGKSGVRELANAIEEFIDSDCYDEITDYGIQRGLDSFLDMWL